MAKDFFKKRRKKNNFIIENKVLIIMNGRVVSVQRKEIYYLKITINKLYIKKIYFLCRFVSFEKIVKYLVVNRIISNLKENNIKK